MALKGSTSNKGVDISYTGKDGLTLKSDITTSSQESDITKAATEGNFFTFTKTIDASKATGALTVTTEGATQLTDLQTGKGADKVTANSDNIAKIVTNAGKDTVTVNKAKSALVVELGAGDDTLKNSVAMGTADLGAGADVVEASAAINKINGEAGGNKKITLNGNGSNPAYTVADITLGKGKDTLTINSGVTVTKLTLGSGDDIVTINQAGTVKTIDASGGGKNSIKVEAGGNKSDKLNFTGGTGVDSVVATGDTSSAGLKTQFGSAAFGDGNNYFEINSGVTVDSATFGKGADKLVIKTGGAVTKADLGAGNDDVTVQAGGSATLTLGEGKNAVWAGGDNINITINDATVGTNSIYVDANKFDAQKISTSNGAVTILTQLNKEGANYTDTTTIQLGSAANGIVNIYDANETTVNNKKVHNLLYSQLVTAQLGTTGTATVDSKSYTGSNVYLYDTGLKTITSDKKRGAMNLYAASNNLESVAASGKADLINVYNSSDSAAKDDSVIKFNSVIARATGTTTAKAFWDTQRVSITSGAGADTIVVHQGDNLYITDFTRGTGKTADFLQADGINAAAKVIDYDQESGDVTLGFLGTNASTAVDGSTDSYVAAVTIAKGLYDGAGKNQEIQIIAGTTKSTMTANAPDNKYTNDAKKGTNVAISSEAGISVINYSNSPGPVTATGTFTDGELTFIGSKGKDTLFGAKDWADKVHADTTDKFSANWDDGGNGTMTDNKTWTSDAKVTIATTLADTDKARKANGTTYSLDNQVYYGKYNEGKTTITELYQVDEDTSETTKSIAVSDGKFSIDLNGYTANFTVSGKTVALDGKVAIYTDTGVADPTALNGGAGNDLIIGNVAGGSLFGGAGNDTLRNGASAASVRADWGTINDPSTMTGGAGNDVFVFTGEGDVVVSDYHNPDKQDTVHGALISNADTKKAGNDLLKADKAAYGNDQLVFAYDKANAKDPQAQVRITGVDAITFTTGTDDTVAHGDVVLTVESKTWDADSVTGGGFGLDYYPNEASITLKNIHVGDYINAQVEGVKYQQYFSTAAEISGLAKKNFNGFFAPNAKKITGNGGVVVGSQFTTAILDGGKKSTLVGNNSDALLSGETKGNVFDIRGGAATVNAGAADNLKNAKIRVYDVSELGNISTVTGGALKIGDTTYANGYNTAITFYDEKEEGQATTKSGRTTWKNVKTTNTMVRAFGTASILSGGASTYLAVYSDAIDDSIVEVKAGAKSNKLHINGNKVEKVTGGAKAEDITVYGNLENSAGNSIQTTVATGKGNDTISGSNIYVSDFTAATYKSKTSTDYKAGDVLAGDIVEVDEDGKLTNARFDGQNVIFGNITLANMKDKNIAYVTYDSEKDEDVIKVVTANNPHELLADKKDKKATTYAPTSEEILYVDTSLNTKGANIDGGKFVEHIYAGKAVDTIVAGLGGNAYDQATKDSWYDDNPAVADLQNQDKTGGSVEITSGAGADFIVFNSGANISDTYLVKSEEKTLDNIRGDVAAANITWTLTTSELENGNKEVTTTTTLGGVVWTRKSDGSDAYTSDVTKEIVYNAKGITYTVKDYSGDKIVLGDNLSITDIDITANGYDTVLSGKGKNQILSAYSDVSLSLSDGNTIKLEKVAVKVSEKSDAPKLGTENAFKITRASEAGSKTFFSFDFGNENVTVAAADGTDFYDISGAKAKKITVTSTKAATIDGSNLGDVGHTSALATVTADQSDSNKKKVAAITYKGATAGNFLNDNRVSFTLVDEDGKTHTATNAVTTNTRTFDAAFVSSGEKIATILASNTTAYQVTIDLTQGKYFDRVAQQSGQFNANASDVFVANLSTDGTIISVIDLNTNGGNISVIGTNATNKTITFSDATINRTLAFELKNTFVYSDKSSLLDEFTSAGDEVSNPSDIEHGSDIALSKATFEYKTTDTALTAATGYDTAAQAVKFTGSTKNDVYYGNGAKDSVYFLNGGNNTIFGGGNAEVTLGANTGDGAKGNDVILIKDGDDITISNYFNTKGKGGTDKIILDTVFAGASGKGALGKITGLEFDSKDLVLTFTGQEGGPGEELAAHATVRLKDYDKTQAVYIGQNLVGGTSAKPKVTASGLLQAAFGTSADGSFCSVTGSSGNDTIEVATDLGINYVKATGGNDVYRVGSNGYATIEGFTTKSTLVDYKTGEGFYSASEISNFDYNSDYVYLGGDSATLTSGSKEVILTGVKKGKADVGLQTNAIKVSTAKTKNSVTLYNKQDVALTAKNAVTDFNLNHYNWHDVTKTFDASKNTKDLTVYANDSLTSYKAGKGKDILTLSDDENAQQVEFTYLAQAGKTDTIVFTKATAKAGNTANKEALKLTAASSNVSLTNYEHDSGSNANTIKADIYNKKKAAGILALTDDSDDGGIFKYTVQISTTKGEAVGDRWEELGIAAKDSSTTYIYTFTAKQKVSSASIVSFGTQDTGVETKSKEYYIKDNEANAKSAEFQATADVQALIGSSFGVDKSYSTTTTSLAFGATRDANGNPVTTGSVSKDVTATLIGQDVSLDGKSGFTINTLKIGNVNFGGEDDAGYRFDEADGGKKTIYWKKSESGDNIEFASSTTTADALKSNYTAYTFGATTAGLYYQLDELTAATTTTISFATTSNFGTATVSELKGKGSGSTTVTLADAITSAYTAKTGNITLSQTEGANTEDASDDKYGLQTTVTLGTHSYDVVIESTNQTFELTDTIKVNNTTVSSNSVTVADKTYTVSLDDGALKFTNTNGVTTKTDGTFVLPDKKTYTIKFDTDEFGSATDDYKLYQGTTEIAVADNKFTIDTPDSQLDKETFIIDLNGKNVTWDKDITYYTFYAEHAEGTANKFFAYSFGTDVFGNSNNTVNLGTAYSSATVLGNDSANKVAQAVLGVAGHGLTVLNTTTTISNGVIVIAGAKGTDASNNGIAGNATITADSFKDGAKVVYTTANTYTGTVELGKKTATDGWDDETFTATFNFGKDASFNKAATVEVTTAFGTATMTADGTIADLKYGSGADDKLTYTYEQVTAGEKGKVTWEYTNTTTVGKGYASGFDEAALNKVSTLREDIDNGGAEFQERFEVEKLYNDFTAFDANDLDNLTEAKTVTTDNDFKSDDFTQKSTADAVLVSTKRDDK